MKLNIKYIFLGFILLSASNSSSAYQHASLAGIKQKMPYSQVREVLIEHGWQAVYNHLYTDEFLSHRDLQMLEVNGWHEVDSCSGTGSGFCNFDFADAYGNKLAVTTIGDCYNEEGQPAQSDEKCDLKVIHWTLRNVDRCKEAE